MRNLSASWCGIGHNCGTVEVTHVKGSFLKQQCVSKLAKYPKGSGKTLGLGLEEKQNGEIQAQHQHASDIETNLLPEYLCKVRWKEP